MGEITGIDFDNGKDIRIETLRRLVKERIVPVCSGIMLNKGMNEISLISVNEIKYVFLKEKKFGAAKGFLIGAVIDVIYFMVILPD
ncbi:hypothetical protein ACFL6G_01715 [candidate division KSB1 bacterium]